MAEGRSERVAIECEDRRVTYRQLFEQVNQVGNSLKNLVVRPEVFLLLLDTPEFAASSGMLVPGILIPCHQPCSMAGVCLDLTYVRQRDFERTLEGPQFVGSPDVEDQIATGNTCSRSILIQTEQPQSVRQGTNSRPVLTGHFSA